MEFFSKIKFKLQMKNLLWTILFLVLTCIVIGIVVSTGFSWEVESGIGIRGFNFSIPIPNFIQSCFFSLFGVLLFIGVFVNVKALFHNPVFHQLIESAERLGNVDAIGNMLATIEKCPYNKGGELRYNDQIFFYLKDTMVALIPISVIDGIRIEKTKSVNNTEEFYVCVVYYNEILKITVDKKSLIPLAEDLQRHLTDKPVVT